MDETLEVGIVAAEELDLDLQVRVAASRRRRVTGPEEFDTIESDLGDRTAHAGAMGKQRAPADPRADERQQRTVAGPGPKHPSQARSGRPKRQRRHPTQAPGQLRAAVHVSPDRPLELDRQLDTAPVGAQAKRDSPAQKVATLRIEIDRLEHAHTGRTERKARELAPARDCREHRRLPDREFGLDFHGDGGRILTMDLYLVRHAIAEESAASGKDADRALTAEGKSRMRAAAEGLRALGVQFDLLLTSPYRRAVETADIVSRVLGGIETRVLPELAAGGDLPALLTALRPLRQAQSLALVGHQPDLGYLASQVMTGSPDACPLAFKKGGVACFEIPTARGPLRGDLLWLMAPKQLRAVAKDR